MLSKLNSIDSFFKVLSYFTVLSGFLSLFVSGTFGLLECTSFLAIIVLAWFLEESKWQISEKLGTVLIVLALPLFYLAWRTGLLSFSESDTLVASSLARLILSLTAIKILQKKTDRDWIFLYLMSFFQILLAAGLNINATYLASFVFYLFIAVCTVIVFEIRKTSSAIKEKPVRNLRKTEESVHNDKSKTIIKRLPAAAAALIVLIVLLAMPMFFLLPRVGGAGLGSSQSSVSTSTGFSDSVNLGEIGRLQQNEQVVMRVRLEKTNSKINYLRWRGVALDTFDNRSWKKSRNIKETFERNLKEYFQINYTNNRDNLAVQTFYLEPIDTNILFAVPRALLVQGNFSFILKDTDDAINFPRNNTERISYQVVSDASAPNIQNLRRDSTVYSPDHQRYLQLPDKMDARISQLAKQVTANLDNRYDKAKALETYLQNNFGYTLDLKVTGEEPLADFLFNIREGHCEYFATALAVMLRTQGIASRVVNGFQPGEYNETADVYVVKQRNAHSWVEVYFPGEDAWIPFDATTFVGQTLETNASTGVIGKFNNYIEALETFWIQYFVAYDNQEQRSLLRSVKKGVTDYQTKTSSWLNRKQREFFEWWKEVRGDKGLETSAKAIGYGIAYLVGTVLGIVLLIWLSRKINKLKIWQNLFGWLKRKNEATIIEFYERMQKVLASKGLHREPHQTPLEFAFALNMPEAVRITEKYNRVRFGEKDLSNNEAIEVENWLKQLENKPEDKNK